MARPTLYTAALGTEICDRVADGETLTAICNSRPDMPVKSTVRRWRDAHPAFRALYAQAREEGGHAWAERALSAAVAATPMTASVARLKFDALRWYASKIAPRSYGDKVQAEVTGPGGGPVTFRWSDAAPAIESTEPDA